MYKIGDKIIPLKRTVEGYGTLSDSVVWEKAMEINQPYLYVNFVNHSIIMANTQNDNSGDYFSISDIIHYMEKPY